MTHLVPRQPSRSAPVAVGEAIDLGVAVGSGVTPPAVIEGRAVLLMVALVAVAGRSVWVCSSGRTVVAPAGLPVATRREGEGDGPGTDVPVSRVADPDLVGPAVSSVSGVAEAVDARPAVALAVAVPVTAGFAVGLAATVGRVVAVAGLGDGVLKGGGRSVGVLEGDAMLGVAVVVESAVALGVGVHVAVEVPDAGTVTQTGPWRSTCPPVSTASSRYP
ncbi:MAG: hypothetical protein PVH41_14015 [Anaerolineae bacterium]